MTRKIHWFIIIYVILLLQGCGRSLNYFEEEGRFFNTVYKIKYEANRLLKDEIEAELTRINNSLNYFNPNSIIAKVNRNEEVEVDSLFITVFNKSMEIAEKSDGIFDATCAPMISLWGFNFNNVGDITPQMVDSVKQFVGYHKIRLEGKKIIKEDPRVQLNFAALVEGYACDLLARLLEKHEVENFMIDLGDEVLTKGTDRSGKYWQVGIRTPEATVDERQVTILQTVKLNKRRGLATTGDYQYFYIRNGKKYAHTINPKTGYPAEQNILSGTVVAKDCLTADGYSTAFVAMGLEKATLLAELLPEVDYFFVYTDDNGHYQFKYSEGMSAFLVNKK